MDRLLLLLRGRFCFSPDGGAGDSGGSPAGSGTQADDTASSSGSGDQASSGQNQPKTYDEAYVKKLRDEAAENRTKRQDAEKRLKEIDDANKTELEKAQARLKELEDEAATLKAQQAQATSREAFVTAATAARAKNPSTVAKLIAQEGIAGADTGKPDAKAITAAIEALQKSDPELFNKVGPTGQDAGAGRGSGGKTDGNQWLRTLRR